ncbi:5-methyltetrahydropteroyltriglutamate--homocysteine S-methyltransferase [Afifella sp. IM 167]|uniref:5-methyltetrahydropteroyltriglutamate-- homocysteine S-methyltransferase n=1 Tax=Afifella sp. IM 167 TaxID=2033586 RepID=UPI001CCB8E43|nr:5-methyltetrahydropteroyltriglutamate--homocysteine S-methyltransferase [Afifella sp. IM 167]MBZ8133146.1 5-methyltetrahydropteroyltriglutamate--homocysteine S-methyltransferase [Afifella sp. IM 167]
MAENAAARATSEQTAKTGAPYRADQVGSLLRPARVKEARKKHYEDKSLSAEELKEVEDEEIARAVRSQESIGMPAVTDGEFRRSFWHYDFLEGLDGIELYQKDEGISFHGANLRPYYPAVTGKVDFSGHPMLEHFTYLAGTARAQPKISIPAPSAAHFRTKPEDITFPAYKDDLEALFSDLTAAYRKAVQAFYDAGCRYIQLDEVFIVYLCDPKIREDVKARGLDPDWLIRQYAKMIDGAVSGRPADMVSAMHLCRGNFRSTWVAEGGYDPAADILFNDIDIDIYFMEYDSERAGGLQPLSALPKGNKRVMPGFITTKTGDLEDIEVIKRRFDEAGKYADLGQLGIAPQCGFSSTEEGNLLSEDDQWRKLELVVKVAESVWGGVDR